MCDGTVTVEATSRRGHRTRPSRRSGGSGRGVDAARRPAGRRPEVAGVGLCAASAQARSGAIDVGNAGTLLRLLPGWLAGQPEGRWTLDGDESIRRRPVDRVAEPLRAMGADVDCRDGRLPPLRSTGATLQGSATRFRWRARR